MVGAVPVRVETTPPWSTSLQRTKHSFGTGVRYIGKVCPCQNYYVVVLFQVPTEHSQFTSQSLVKTHGSVLSDFFVTSALVSYLKKTANCLFWMLIPQDHPWNATSSRLGCYQLPRSSQLRSVFCWTSKVLSADCWAPWSPGFLGWLVSRTTGGPVIETC